MILNPKQNLTALRGPQKNTLEAQLPIYWVTVLKSLDSFILSVTPGPAIRVPGLLVIGKSLEFGGRDKTEAQP